MNVSGQINGHQTTNTQTLTNLNGHYTGGSEQRMEALGSMASSLAHECNNLMTVVIANLEMISQGSLDPRVNVLVGRAIWAAERTAQLNSQILSFARPSFHDLRHFDLNSRIRNMELIMDQFAGSSTAVELDLSLDALPVHLDAGQLEMALLNLVRNSADAMPHGGKIRIATLHRGECAEVSVHDSGCGMSAELLAHVKEPYFTTKAPGKGTGLGLPMVNGFAEQSGGQMTIESTEGVGTIVRLAFPLAGNASD